MARVSIIIETPSLVRVGLPIVCAASYDIQRQINAAGTWIVEFPASEALSDVVKSRWRVSIVEEGRPGYILRRGIVTGRLFNTQRDGQGLLRLSGFSRLYGVQRLNTHIGLDFDGSQPILDVCADLAGEVVTAPTVPDIADRAPEVTFDDTSKLAGFLGAIEYCRLNVREKWDGDFELVAWDDVPDSGYRFVTVDRAGPELLTAGENGMGLIAGTPSISYAGQDLANRIIPIGVDFDGSPLTLEHSDRSDPFPILEGTNPDGTSYWYIEDAESIADTELIEAPYVRSDVKNPNDNLADRTKAANALYALAAARLISSKADVIAFASEIANGRQVDALPGDRVLVQFRGRARSFSGAGNFWKLEQHFLIDKRRDAAASAGIRGVSFTLTAPEISLAIEELPEAVPIPPPPRDPPNPPEPTGRDPGDTASDEADDPEIEDGGVPDMAALPDLDLSSPIGDGRGAYQPCCADPTAGLRGGETPVPPL